MTSAPQTLPAKKNGVNNILPISSLRFVLAMWVVAMHFGLPILKAPQPDKILWAARAFLNNAFNAPAAVIVFFVISGFCIHFPNRNGLEVSSWKIYYARRYLRILIPMTVAILLSLPLQVQFGLFTGSVLWSLLCEEIYYFLYPALLALRDRIGWRYLMALAWVFAFLTVLTNPGAGDYGSYGARLNWVLGLPCWLLGCQLAERVESLSAFPVSAVQIWMWRGSAYVLSVVLSVLRFHSPLRYPWTLDLFAVFAVFWLEREIRFYRTPGRVPRFESLGKASYSIYLTHVLAWGLLQTLPATKAMSIWAAWFAEIALCAGLVTIFYWLVERPSHRFARRVAKQAAWLRPVVAAASASD